MCIRDRREVWPVGLVTGLSFAVAQFITSNFISVELTDIVASLVGLAATVAFLRVWHPQGAAEARARLSAERDAQLKGETFTEHVRRPLTGERVWMGLFPYLLVVVVFSASKLIPALKNALAATDVKVAWPGLDGHILAANGKAVSSTIYTFPWLSLSLIHI